MAKREQKIILHDDALRRRAMSFLAALDLSKPWEVTIKPYRKRRTLNQNSLMWAWLNEVAGHVEDHTGQDADDIHEFFKQKFLHPKVIEIGGETVLKYTTTELSTAEMKDYMDRIYAFVTQEFGIMLPLPEEMHQRGAA